MNTKNSIAYTKRAGLIKIGIDMHLRNYRVVRQIDQSHPQPRTEVSAGGIFQWLDKQRQLAERVVVCYEAGCFGYEPARRMQAMGVEVYVIAPQNWDEQGKGQVNDKHDAQVMCRRLSEYLGGHRQGAEHRAHSLAARRRRGGPGGGCASNCSASCGGCKRWGAVSYCKGRWR